MMYIERDDTGATYYRLNANPVARTVHVSDLVRVDVDVDDVVVGVEAAMDAGAFTLGQGMFLPEGYADDVIVRDCVATG